jgi:serine/threonine protein kinase/tetratricopeptide (TPR) repeat protein
MARNARAVFDEAHEIHSPDERKAFLDQACANEPELRQKVEALLRAHEEAGSFLQTPAVAPGETGAYQPGGDTPVHSPLFGAATVAPESAAAAAPVEGVGAQIGPYRLIEELGAGGMGAVYLAEQEQPIRRQVALKLIKSGMDGEGIIARFEAERQALSMMEHPNIARVFEAGATATGQPYFVMELVRGVPMTRFCDENKLTVRERLQLFETVCEAIQHAHTKGVLHRDIKPGNVLISLQDGKPVPKVIDFGLAKAMKGSAQPLVDQVHQTQFGAIVGTLEYMSPEQADPTSEGADTRTDVYSLGVLLYELLTGTTPLDSATLRGANLIDVVLRIHQDVPPPPSARLSGLGERLTAIAAERKTEPARLVRSLRGELECIALKALEKDRKRRYDTASGLAKDVRRYLDDELVEACPPTVSYRLGKFARKHRVLLAAAASIAALLVLGVVGLTIGIVKVDQARRAEEAAKVTAVKAEKRTRRALDITWSGIRAQVRQRTRPGPAEEPIVRNMLEGYKQLVESEPGASREAQAAAAEGAFREANLSALIGDNDDAEAGYHKAMQLYAALAAEFKDEAEYRTELARCNFDLASLLIQKGKPAEAEKAYRRAAEILEKVAARFPDAAYQRELADVYNDLGVLLRDGKELVKADKAYREAVALGEKAAAAEPDRLQYRINLAASYHNLGNIVRDQGDPRAALALYGKAIGLLNPIKPRPADATVFLRNACWDRANALGQVGRHADASAMWKNALDLESDGPAQGPLRLFLAASQMEEKLHAAVEPAGELLYDAATLYAQATGAAAAVDEQKLQERYATRTLELLKQAKNAGWFRDPQRIKRLKEDKAFEALPAADLKPFLESLRPARGANDPPDRR